MMVKNEQITEWGSYSDRRNSFDDDADIKRFVWMAHNDISLKNYLLSFLPRGKFSFKSKPDGQYGVDLGLFSEQDELVATIDIERWSAWKDEWPSYYRHIHFLGRKEKFLTQNDAPFFMAFLNYTKNKAIVISKKDIEKYPTINKYFSHKKVTDRVKEISLSDGHVFGKNITNRERQIFQKTA